MITWVAIAFICAILYRIGGKGGFAHAKLIRRLGIPLVMIGALTISHGWSWWYLLSGVLLYASLTTYYDRINKYFGADSVKEYWWNWVLHIGLARLGLTIPLYFAGVLNLEHIILSFFIFTIIGTIYCELEDTAIGEELMRGYLITLIFPI